MKTIEGGSIVSYKGIYFLFLGATSLDKARLMSTEGVMYSGTPGIDKITLVKKLEVYAHKNGHRYVVTKLGNFSLSTGKKVSDEFMEDSVPE